ncbi:probable G-protein coupled receptor 139 [Mytilus trossulus]|uniref:probable G-protein coupled receptor 139 n=1 Tax=Mytilus trossulus TaxID=6551 RepID=UPI0030059E14
MNLDKPYDTLNYTYSYTDNTTMDHNITSIYNESIEKLETQTVNLHKLYVNIYTIVVPIIAVVGLFGNTASIAVFTSSFLKRHSSSVFLAALAFVDNLFLLTLFLTWFDQTASNILSTTIPCQIVVYVTYFAAFLSVWLVVGFTTERYLAICHPLRAPMLCSNRRQKIAVTCLVLFAAVFYTFAIWTTEAVQYGPRKWCLTINDYYEFLQIVTWIDTIISMVLPFFCIAFMNCRVICKAAIFHKKRQHCYKPTDSLKVKRNKHLTNKSQMRVTRTLLIVSSLFLVLNFPSHLARLYNIIVAPVSKEKYEKFLQQICQLLYYSTFSVNFFVYALYGKHFQKSFWLMIRSFKQFFGCRTEHRFSSVEKSTKITLTGMRSNTYRWSSDLDISRC